MWTCAIILVNSSSYLMAFWMCTGVIVFLPAASHYSPANSSTSLQIYSRKPAIKTAALMDCLSEKRRSVMYLLSLPTGKRTPALTDPLFAAFLLFLGTAADFSFVALADAGMINKFTGLV